MASSLEKLVTDPPTEHPIDVRWRSFELRPKDAPPLPPDYLAKIEAGRPRLYAIAREVYDLDMNPGPFGFDSRPALTGAKVAEEAGHGPAYHAAIMRAYWQEARDIADPDVLADIAASAGVERATFAAAIADPHYGQQVAADIQTAREYGLSGVPALVFDNRYLVSGAQPLETLREVVEKVVEARAADEADPSP